MDVSRVSIDYLREYVARLERAIRVLPDGDTWWKPHGSALSVGTILAHLSGNVRQWIVSGIGAAPDGRDRAAEFAMDAGPDALDLLRTLDATVGAAIAVIDGMDASMLEREYLIQGSSIRGWEAVLHVVEHFSWHTGQVVWIAKARAGASHGLAFVDDAKVNRASNHKPME